MNARNYKRHTERDPAAPDDNVKSRKRVSALIEKIVRDRLASGRGMLTISKELKIGSGTVQRIKREMTLGRLN